MLTPVVPQYLPSGHVAGAAELPAQTLPTVQLNWRADDEPVGQK